MPMLEVRGVSRFFGGLAALTDVSFNLEQGEILAVIGPNGAGKTTLFNLLSGIYAPDEGRFVLDGEDVSNSAKHSSKNCSTSARVASFSGPASAP